MTNWKNEQEVLKDLTNYKAKANAEAIYSVNKISP